MTSKFFNAKYFPILKELAMPQTAYYSRNLPRKCISRVLEAQWGGIGVDSKIDMIDCLKTVDKGFVQGNFDEQMMLLPKHKFMYAIEKYCDEYKPVRKPRIKTPAQVVKKITYLDEWKKYKSIDPVEIPRARMLFTYNTSSKKLTKFEGHLSARGSRITGYDECVEKTLTDLKLLDRLVEGGNIIASKFMDEIPRSKLKEGNDLPTKNTLLIKVIK